MHSTGMTWMRSWNSFQMTVPLIFRRDLNRGGNVSWARRRFARDLQADSKEFRMCIMGMIVIGSQGMETGAFLNGHSLEKPLLG